MPSTVDAAFAQFLSNSVSLDADITASARGSRDWLMSQVSTLGTDDEDFPLLYSDINMHYGSFARRTKIRELDDIDLIVGLMAMGTTYSQTPSQVELCVPEGVNLRQLCHDGTNKLNSKKVINAFVRQLRDIPQYAKSEIRRDGSAAVLNLQSRPWSFDIVPAFFTTKEADGRDYYIIPDGNGYWKKTDPRIDQARVTRVNQAHSGNILDVVRVMKFWNGRATMPTMSSYMLETVVLDFYDRRTTAASQFVDMEAKDLLEYMKTALFMRVDDPKGIEGDINKLSWNDRLAIAARASADFDVATEARKAENDGNHRTAIRLWGDIFGPAFPSYN